MITLHSVLKYLNFYRTCSFKLYHKSPWMTTYKFNDSLLQVSVHGSFTYQHIIKGTVEYALRIDCQHSYVTLRVPSNDDPDHMEVVAFFYFDDKMYTEEEYFQESLVKDLPMEYDVFVDLLKYVRMVKVDNRDIFTKNNWPSL